MPSLVSLRDLLVRFDVFDVTGSLTGVQKKRAYQHEPTYCLSLSQVHLRCCMMKKRCGFVVRWALSEPALSRRRKSVSRLGMLLGNHVSTVHAFI